MAYITALGRGTLKPACAEANTLQFAHSHSLEGRRRVLENRIHRQDELKANYQAGNIKGCTVPAP